VVKQSLMVIIFLFIFTFLVTGCESATDLDVNTPSSVDVTTASINDDGTLNCIFTTTKGGTLQFNLDLQAVITPEDNPNILSGSMQIARTISFEMDVEAGEDYDISPQFNVPSGDITWGTLFLEFK